MKKEFPPTTQSMNSWALSLYMTAFQHFKPLEGWLYVNSITRAVYECERVPFSIHMIASFYEQCCTPFVFHLEKRRNHLH